MSIATFGAGCFWNVEAVFAELDGVLDTRAGYMGGHVEDPTYDQVCEGDTGHIEVVEVDFDETVISYAELLAAFWAMHDPTSWDRQGPDEGEAYRSVIFVSDAQQADAAEYSRDALGQRLEDPIVTEIREATTFWVAEDDHQLRNRP